jgi:exodeoxyribonuclease V beta subunit
VNTDEAPETLPPPFDLPESPLVGTTLIEAGAGTGKTYTITGIVLRLIVEQKIPISRILAVTFTEAATEELKGRIRDRLKLALGVLRGEAMGDRLLERLAEKWDHRSKSGSAEAIQALKEAVRDFDEAAIFTIHGFCNRMLRENAFESGALFDTELTADQDGIRRAVVEDFWRTRLYTADPIFVRYVLAKTNPEALFALLSSRHIQPDIAVIPVGETPDTRIAEAAFQKGYASLQKTWASCKEEIVEILLNAPGLHRGIYKTALIPVWTDILERYLRRATPHPIPPEKFDKFTRSGLTKGTKKSAASPDHPFFRLCDEFKQACDALNALYAQKLVHLKRELITYAGKRIRERMRESNRQSFDDLLQNMSEALKTPGGSLLAERIRGRYQAALIDEFQDTDPVQYHIFKTLFDTPGHRLFLIGDPKQAIYSFRGADIFAYMAAARSAAARYTLLTNWRSDPGLVTAVNTVFSSCPQAFVYGEIPFGPAGASEDKSGAPGLSIDGEKLPPLTVWRLEQSGKGDARQEVIRATATEISRLLDLGGQGRARLQGNPVRAGDIAVLVRTNREAAAVHESLTALGIPAVLYNTGDIFDTHEAAETARILAALVEPRNDARVRAALVSDMMGVNGEELAGGALDEDEWETRLTRFDHYHRLWRERGFIRMFKAFLAEEGVLSRLMRLPDGERRCTNIRHLSELLHQASLSRNMSPSRLTAWLSEQRFNVDHRSEEHPLRLESDENAVKLVTIHKSKGLEYGLVFCPFVWVGSRWNDTDHGILFHNEDSGRQLTLDLGSGNMSRHRRMADKEILAENLRLLYVALTRAKHRCIFAWGPVNAAEIPAPAYLLRGDAGPIDTDDPLERLEERLAIMDDAGWEKNLTDLERRSGGTIRIERAPRHIGVRQPSRDEKSIPLDARRFSGRIPFDFGVSSFSSIVSIGSERPTVAGGLNDPAELADHDDFTAVDETAAASAVNPSTIHDGKDIFAFPRGARACTCLHEIFEHLDFTRTDEKDLTPLIHDILRKYRFDAAWIPAVAGMIRKVMKLDLDAAKEGCPDEDHGKDVILSLSAVTPKRRINEMAFYFPAPALSGRRLAAVFAAHGITGPSGNFPERIGQLTVSRTRGMMKGFIDLVFEHRGRFYIVDWKSNHLGDQPKDYSPEILETIMTDAFYTLQYHLYALALHRYLRHRVPGYDPAVHFGGVRYLFVRGVDPEVNPAFGMFKDRPAAALIEDLDRLFTDIASDDG